MRTAVLTAVLATALLTAGCGEQKRLETELATANSRIAEMDSTLEVAHMATNTATRRADSLSRSLAAAEAGRDSLTESLKSARARAGRLEGDLKTARANYAKSLDSLKGENTMLAEQVRNWESQMQNAEAQIATMQERSEGLMRERDSLYSFVDQVQPWFDYYKHESHRNWLKKLFGAGDAKKPSAPEPEFPVPTAKDLEAHTP